MKSYRTKKVKIADRAKALDLLLLDPQSGKGRLKLPHGPPRDMYDAIRERSTNVVEIFTSPDVDEMIDSSAYILFARYLVQDILQKFGPLIWGNDRQYLRTNPNPLRYLHYDRVEDQHRYALMSSC